jgi:hypothetical protein
MTCPLAAVELGPSIGGEALSPSICGVARFITFGLLVVEWTSRFKSLLRNGHDGRYSWIFLSFENLTDTHDFIYNIRAVFGFVSTK